MLEAAPLTATLYCIYLATIVFYRAQIRTHPLYCFLFVALCNTFELMHNCVIKLAFL